MNHEAQSMQNAPARARQAVERLSVGAIVGDKHTNERTNKGTNERTNEQTNKRTNERTNGQTNEQTNEQTNKRTNNRPQIEPRWTQNQYKVARGKRWGDPG